ncbi:hypothetical protein [Actinoplanes solisilvae]|uniref:hypothetical protein n=1 Tax=Actinoplanes solisilvae TaxID=2486853 RepID=UPI000FD88F93|nr:hypothetical protein [Actinoplanes solisilvae]
MRNRSAGARHHRRGSRRPSRGRGQYLWPAVPALLRILTHLADDPSGLLDLASAAVRRLGGWVL